MSPTVDSNLRKDFKIQVRSKKYYLDQYWCDMKELMDDDKAAMVILICSGLVRLVNNFDNDAAKSVTAGATTTDPDDS